MNSIMQKIFTGYMGLFKNDVVFKEIIIRELKKMGLKQGLFLSIVLTNFKKYQSMADVPIQKIYVNQVLYAKRIGN